MIGEIVDCSSEFKLETFYGCFVGCVSEISGCVEGFFNAERVILYNMPFLGFFGETSPLSNGNDLTVIVEFKCESILIMSKERYLTKNAYNNPPRVSVFLDP